jgi:hypothetical protein
MLIWLYFGVPLVLKPQGRLGPSTNSPPPFQSPRGDEDETHGGGVKLIRTSLMGEGGIFWLKILNLRQES